MRGPRGRRGIAGWQATLAVALLLLGFLVAGQVRAQVSTAQYSSLERPALIQTIQDLQKRHGSLVSDIDSFRSQIAGVEAENDRGQSDLVSLDRRLASARLAAGYTPVQGPGGYVRLGDGHRVPGDDGDPADFRIDASDLRTLVDCLWRSGAEAISIGKERVVTSTSILDVGGSIRVNSSYVTDESGQYVISVIGPADMWARLSILDAFRTWMQTRYGPYHLAIQYEADAEVLLPGYTGSASLRWGQPSAVPSGGR